ncbi:MAG: hypothetical protein ACLQOO_11045 [Terriglobia bacterium]
MFGFQFAARKVRCWLPILLWTSGLDAQTCLVLSPATIAPDHTAWLDLALYASPGMAPAAVQWTFQYPASSISSLTVDDGPMLTSAGKTAICAGNAAAYNCLAVGRNTKTIANGVIAKVTAVLAPGATTATVQITNPRAASAGGYQIPIVSKILSAPSRNLSSDCKYPATPKGLVRDK